MEQSFRRAGAVLVATIIVTTGCAGPSHSAGSHGSAASTTAVPTLAVSSPAAPTGVPTSAPPTGPPITAQSFGMHYLGFGTYPYPPLPFGTARVWDMGVTWKDLQPTATTRLSGEGGPALQRLDRIIRTFRAHQVEPMITLGQTPAWAVHPCRHVFRGLDWGLQTCAPNDPSMHGAWAQYVRAMAIRYRHSVHYFELWNEPSLRNGYNDSPATLALMQRTAHRILQSLGFGQELVSPSIAFTDGATTHGLRWLDRFLALPGGVDFDIAGFHLYPSDPSAKAGFGPEWSATSTLPAVRAVLAAHGAGDRPLWDTETNVGRIPAGIRFVGAQAAAMLARTFVLAPEYGIARTIWYGVNDYGFGGVSVEVGTSSRLSPAGRAERFVRDVLVGARPRGCEHPGTDPPGRYTCTFTLSNGGRLQVLWTTTARYPLALPARTNAFNVVGRPIKTRSISVGAVPVYLVTAAHA